MRAGFSLVELSIVLVILGLLAGGVLTGQSLIHAAELRKVNTFQSEFINITNTFRDKYQALPGDMPNATLFWGRSNAAADNCTTQPGTASATGTCNGDGDGYIPYGAGAPGEQRLNAHHLRLAGLISPSNTPTGIAGSLIGGTGFYTPGISRAISWVGGCDAVTGCAAGTRSADLYYWLAGGDPVKGNALQTAQPRTSNGTLAVAVITPEDLWNIDTKIDDGLPKSGVLRGMDGIEDNAVTVYLPCSVTTGGNSTYNVTYTDKACRFMTLLK